MSGFSSPTRPLNGLSVFPLRWGRFFWRIHIDSQERSGCTCSIFLLASGTLRVERALQQVKELRQCVGMFTQPFCWLLSFYSDQYRLLPHGSAYRIVSACKGGNGAIQAIVNSPATPNVWPRRAVLVLIAGSIPIMRSRPGGLAPIGSDTTEWSPTGSSVHFFSEQCATR